MSDIKTGAIYKGSPANIIQQVAQEIADVLHKANVPLSGVHVLALLHLAASMVRAESAKTGKMPSFRSILSLMTRNMTDQQWSGEEVAAFDDEFCEIVESLGGRKLTGREVEPIILSPSLGVH